MQSATSDHDVPQVVRVVRCVQRGVKWLKETADSLSDARDIAITVSALIAAEKNPHSHLIQRLSGKLQRKQGVNGSWSDELWDTVWAARALSDAGYVRDNEILQSAIRFVEVTQDPLSGTWYEEPFETMLVIDLLARIAPDKMQAVSERALKWLALLQRSEGAIIGMRYTGMAASLFYLVQRCGITGYENIAQRATAYIHEQLKRNAIWTAASWSNYYPLAALLDSGITRDDPLLEKAIEWFLQAQDTDGKWMQVSRVHDTAMAILALSRLLTIPLVDISDPRVGVLGANRENGTIRVSFHGPGAGAIAPAERMKISDQVRSDLSHNQQLVVAALGRLRSKPGSVVQKPKPAGSVQQELEKAGKYAYGHMIPARIQVLLETSPADHLRLDIDERLIDLPWELVHDGTDFLCLRYALGRRLVSDQSFAPPSRHVGPPADTRVLVVADPTADLPAARREGAEIASLLRDKCGMQVDEYVATDITKKDFLLSLRDYDIVHYAGHATHEADSPDESCLVFSDGDIQAFEIGRFLAGQTPTVVFLNACWSAEELRNSDSYTPMMRGLGRTFLYAGVPAFLGYLVPVPDLSATRCAIAFYEALAQGHTIGECLRQARIRCRNPSEPNDLTWSSAVLYGDPSARAIDAATTAGASV